MAVVLTERADRILTVTVNRPEKLNALNGEVLEGLREAFHAAKADPEIGALIVTGAGEKAFVAGADISTFPELTPATARDLARRGQVVFDLLERLGTPSIAAINGYALGGGCELAMACTLRIASRAARLGQPEVNLGLIPGYGGTQRLPRLVGKGRALELILTGDPISAEEAHRICLVNRVVEPAELLPASFDLLRKILSRAPAAVRATL
ncbi:MAG TPA: enoyl-CoA hydratase-related protein, partial [Thermoanaerobaculia bacterium]|nr:enoyl-CoA hydratase-related protein [Thermoanaerobaculia bacterium]